MKSLSLQTKVKASPEILCREIEGEAVVLNPKSGVYFGLDPMGTRIWHWIERQKSLGQVCNLIQDEFSVSEARCQTDVLEFAQHLHKNGLIEITSSR